MQKGLVSVIIPNHNYARYIGEAVDGVLAQTYADIEIIVVDDGSTDNSEEILSAYGDRINVIFQQNQGVSAARNNGVRSSRGQYLAFLDADDSWMPQKLEKQVRAFEDQPDLGLVHVGVREIDAEGHGLRDRLDGLNGDISADLLMFKRDGVLGGGSGFVVPRAVFDEIGEFDTRLSTSADWDFFYQISSRYPIGFVPEVLVQYRVHSSNMHSNIAVMEHDMTLAFDKAFTGSPTVDRRTCYGNLYKILAGSYLRAGDHKDFVRCALSSLRYEPSNLGYFLMYPLRRARARS
jgi:glycosyltransferase involved in cell wall biosynthesis